MWVLLRPLLLRLLLLCVSLLFWLYPGDRLHHLVLHPHPTLLLMLLMLLLMLLLLRSVLHLLVLHLL